MFAALYIGRAEALPFRLNHCNFKIMELAERIELSTSPLPRECSATELRQPDVLHIHCDTTLLSYRERSLVSTTRAAKKPRKTNVNLRYFKSSNVNHAEMARSAKTTSATIILPLPAGLISILQTP